jgi:hypothetical protein
MKKIFVSIAMLACVAAKADEGMWLPQLLGQQKYAEMKAKGLKLTAEQLYSINKPSIKDAIVIFGSGCTGEIVSAQGLVFTNHHCGFDAIAKASTVEHNYLQDGFYATRKEEEIPAQGLSVQFLVKIDDITAQVQDSLKAYPNWADWMSHKDSVFARIGRAAVAGTGYEGKVFSMFKDNQFLLYTFEKYTDIRLVGTPPQSVGKFGGDTDNWEWPRHTGDFSIFRVYASADGKPSAYNKNNTPLKPKYFLPISTKGVKQGDFTMIFGYPGSTNRFETSMGVKLTTDIKNPAFVYMRDIRLKAMFEEMKKDPATKLKLASSYASLANYWKFYDGETKQLLKYDVYGTKKKQEDALSAWAKAKPEYANIFNDYNRAYSAWMPYAKQKEYYEQGIAGTAPAYSNGPQAIRFANRLEAIERLLLKGGGDLKKKLAEVDSLRTVMLAEIDKPSEQRMLWQVVKAFNSDIAADQQPVLFYNNIKQKYGPLKDDDTYKLWAAYVFANTFIFNDAKWKEFLKYQDVATIQSDPLYVTATAFRENWKKYKPQLDAFTNANAQLGYLYLKAWREMNPKLVMYPDANFSMRTSFGAVKAYQPQTGVTYDFVTTSKGILEKYKPGDYEFDLPAKEIELLRSKDFGAYVDAKYKDLVVNFITTDDITGGNSGSPVINANGELIGLAFDGNYEALSHKINFDKDLCRTICLDVRYLLWCVDKLGGASNIISELKIIKPVAGK